MFSYRILITLLSPIIIVFFAWHSFKKKQSRYLIQHLGFGLSKLPKDSIWLHCASVGEVITAMPLVHKLSQTRATPNIIITTNTTTGAKVVAQQKLPNLTHCYLPFDMPFAVKRFIRKLKPKALFVVETEIWPHLFYYCQKENCPVSIINARLSIKTTGANAWVKSLLKTTLQFTNAIYTRSALNEKAYIELGADKNKIRTIGNLKYCQQAAHEQTVSNHSEQAHIINQDYVLVASTHDDEEIQIVNNWFSLDQNALLLIAPRHPERCTNIVKQIQSNWPDKKLAIYSHNDEIEDNTDIYILDTVGKLIDYFADAKIVIMGGSFVNIGGHNILEPAQFGRAIICGPHMQDFSDEVALMLNDNALLQVSSYQALNKALAELLNNKEARRKLEKGSKNISANFDHIVNEYAKIVEDTLR